MEAQMLKKLTTYPRPLPNNPVVVEYVGMDNKSLFDKINELVDAVNELQKRIDLPSAYEVMREKDAIIGRHIGENNRLREALETANLYLMKIGYLNMIDWCKAVALEGISKIKPILEQKEEDDDE